MAYHCDPDLLLVWWSQLSRPIFPGGCRAYAARVVGQRRLEFRPRR